MKKYGSLLFVKTEEEKPYSNKDKDDKRNFYPFPTRG